MTCNLTEVKEFQSEYDSIYFEKYNLISSYHDIREQLDRLSIDFRSYLTKPEYLLPFLQPGRMIKVSLYISFFFTIFYKITFSL